MRHLVEGALTYEECQDEAEQYLVKVRPHRILLSLITLR